MSRIFGGVWDRRKRRYTGHEPDATLVRWRPVTAEQFEYCHCGKFRITGKGGRGGGKTEALAQRVECLILDRPRDSGLVLSPDYPHTEIIEDALLPRIWDWLRPGSGGINITKHLWRTIFGAKIKFLSAERPAKLKGYGAGWLAVDEEALVPDEAIENCMLCLRKSRDPLVFGAGTPEVGVYSIRYAKMQAQEGLCRLFSFPSLDNVFISQAIFERSMPLMDSLRYRQEVLAEFVRLDAGSVVAKAFDPARHRVDLDAPLLRDITRSYTTSRVKRPFKFVVGVDYNKNFPCVGWVYRIFAPGLWVVIDRIAAADPATHLAQALIDAGYGPRDAMVVDDASGEYDRNSKREPGSSSRMLRQFGFLVLHKQKNPLVKDRVNAFLAKLDPHQGVPTWGYTESVAKWVVPVMQNTVWDDPGNSISKKEGYDHDFDAATYPIVYFEPAMAIQIPRTRGVMPEVGEVMGPSVRVR